ncbi:MAG: hypothetical protein HYW65_04580 [Candidatus Liptonbacteria bacterium]|nr:hypothetical protein [Candidatus Liptonbacteria bacterium]
MKKIITIVGVVVLLGLGGFAVTKFSRPADPDLAGKEKAIAQIKEKYSRERNPEVYILSQPKEIAMPESFAAYPLNNYLGLEFRVPETNQLDKQSEKFRSMKKLLFPNGKSLIVSYAAGTSTPRAELSTLFNKEDAEKFMPVGGDTIYSWYAFRNFVLESSPDNLSTSMTIPEIEAREVAIKWKRSDVFVAPNSKVYSFETSNGKGFLSEAAKGSRMIALFFGPYTYELALSPGFSERDVDVILASARRVE